MDVDTTAGVPPGTNGGDPSGSGTRGSSTTSGDNGTASQTTSDPRVDLPCEESRADGACRIRVPVNTGSIQNPAWSPDGGSLILTHWQGGYNASPADVMLYDLIADELRPMTTDGQSNVNMPGTTWSPVNGQIVFSSEASGDGDQAHVMSTDGAPGSATRITPFSDAMAWEPGWSPDAQWVIYEAHFFDNVGPGVIARARADGSGDRTLISQTGLDCRQPSWAPQGTLVVYQCFDGDRWTLWLDDADSPDAQPLTLDDPGNATDASFSADGQWVVYSSSLAELEHANIYIKPIAGGAPVRVTNYEGYDGAPGWSVAGVIGFESSPGDPDGSSGTTLWYIEAPR